MSIHADYARKVDALMAENHALTVENERLRKLLLPAYLRGRCLPGLTAREEAILRALLAEEVVSVERVTAAQAPDKPVTPDTKNVTKVLVSRMRKKLAPYGASITGIWGVGYRLEGRENVLDAIERAAEGR